jgi:hypothetical protein
MTKYYLMQGTTVLDKTYVPDNFKHAENYFLWAGWFIKAIIVRVDPYDDDQQVEYDYRPKRLR